MTPPVPSIPQQYYPPIYENSQQQQPQPQQVQQNTSYNPFMQQQTQPQQAPQINTSFQSNPFMQQMQQQGQNVYQSPVEQLPQQYRSASASHSFQNSYQNQPQPQPQSQSNPFLQNNQPQQSYDYQQQTQFQQPARQQTFPLMSQQTGRADKRTILDLYNYPQVAPTPQHSQQDQMQAQNMAMPPAGMAGGAFQQQPRSVSSPLATQMAGNRNPFMSSGVHSAAGDTLGSMNPFPQTQNAARHASQESVSIDTGGWQNGRHSPDAWGTISARSTR